MVDFDAYTPFGTTAENSTDVYQDQWNRIFQAVTGDGLVGELTAALTGRYTFTASGSDTNLIVTPNDAPGIIAAGHTGWLSEAKSIDIDADGAPGSGVRRIDWCVARVNRAGQKMELSVVTGSPGTGVPPTLETDRGGDLEVPLALIDRTGPVNLTNAMITVTSLRPSPGWFVGTALGTTVLNSLAIPDGGTVIQGHKQFVSVRNAAGTAMELRELNNPTWTNLTLASASGYSAVPGATPQYRVIGDAFELRGIVQRSGSGWVNGATIATFPLSVRELLPNAASTWHRHDDAVLYASTSALGVAVPTTVRVQLSESGGIVYLPNAAAVSSSANRLDLSSVRVTP